MYCAMDIHDLLARLPFKRFKEPPPSVAVLPLTGVIGSLGPMRSGMTLAALAPRIEQAFKLPRLKAVALAINSPGGSAVQSALIAGRIRALAEENEVPVIAFAEDVAASGGYWLATAADEIYADQSSIVGSIGVVASGFGFQGLIERFGIERRLHTAGEKKAMLDPFQPEKSEEVEHLKVIQQEIHETFMGQVRSRRGDRLKAAEDELFSGAFWTGARALDLGLVDGLGDLRQVMRSRYGEKVRLRRIEAPKPWWRRLSRGTGDTGMERLAQQASGGLLAAAEERALWSRYGL